jgi:Leucine-rich repeat (LRR) protein
MKKIFALCLAIWSVNASATPTDSLHVYTWAEALKANPDSVFSLSLEKMKLETLPAELMQFRQLRKLDLSKNRLTKLPENIAELSQLRELDLGKNDFENFPLELCQLTELRRLILNRNPFSMIPDCIRYLTQLNYLDLWDTPIQSFPEAFTDMHALKSLDVRGLRFSPSFQERWRERLPWMKIEFEAPCDCMR